LVRNSHTAQASVFILIKSSVIIEDIKYLQEAKSALMAFYYFDAGDPGNCDLRGLLSSLLIQLSDDSLGCLEVLRCLYTTCGDGRERPSETELAECLKSMLDLPGQLPIYIIVDALDECIETAGNPTPRQSVLDFVGDLVACNHSSLSICITSRPEQDIQATLSHLTSAPRRVSLHEESGQKEDINIYVRYVVHSHRTMHKWSAEHKEITINTLIERAGGS
jgi:hypothetical protein